MTPDYNINEAQKSRSWIRMLAFPFILFLLGGAAIAWLLTQTEAGRSLVAAPPAPQSEPAQTLAAPQVPAVTPPVPLPPAPVPVDMASRIASLEARIAQLEARGTSGGSSRADALFAVFSARRALERGAALGAIETELNSRFGTAHPRAVAAISTAARQPTSIGLLTQQLRDLAPTLSNNGGQADWWSRFTNGLSNLIVIRDSSEPSLDPEQRITAAERLLTAGQVEGAISQISALPQRAQATNWMASARRYAEAMRALDELDAASLAPPAPVVVPPPLVPPLPTRPGSDSDEEGKPFIAL